MQYKGYLILEPANNKPTKKPVFLKVVRRVGIQSHVPLGTFKYFNTCPGKKNLALQKAKKFIDSL